MSLKTGGRPLKTFVVFGTRPEAIKLAPVIHALRGAFDVRVVFTGQHPEMTRQVTDFFKIAPCRTFNCMTERPDLEKLRECIQRRLRTAIEEEDPDLVIVHGDTITCYASAFAGFLSRKPVFHIEAGLRSANRFSPFPEEMLRRLTARLADFHFAPTAQAAENLLNEGVRGDRILTVGNTAVDAVELAVRMLNEKTALDELAAAADRELMRRAAGKKLILITAHRRENIGLPLRRICRSVIRLARRYGDLLFLWSLHKNPDVRKIVFDEFREKKPENIVLAEPLSYQAMVYLMKTAHIIMTDSGGIQEEAPSFGKPVILMREQTERPEAITAGISFLAGRGEENITRTFERLHEDPALQSRIREAAKGENKNPFGDGRAAERIRGFLMLDEVRCFIEGYPGTAESVLDVKPGGALRAAADMELTP